MKFSRQTPLLNISINSKQTCQKAYHFLMIKSFEDAHCGTPTLFNAHTGTNNRILQRWKSIFGCNFQPQLRLTYSKVAYIIMVRTWHTLHSPFVLIEFIRITVFHHYWLNFRIAYEGLFLPLRIYNWYLHNSLPIYVTRSSKCFSKRLLCKMR